VIEAWKLMQIEKNCDLVLKLEEYGQVGFRNTSYTAMIFGFINHK
jgi:hypothetical protein